ncbi:aspartate aminotransferase family protein [Verminephrobacter eiseniae]|uniref:aspartate aminotransferase family protein n=1 Tax=Verminephrobacter eiseniae TaxID=364317 RepID=UPI0010D9CF94|nr:aspartate aminotransferase family protein [Verminephrobacter eiseniae]KAB7615079.1 aspartate aminotransferase family protein [Verminephrobacter sp. Larva24]MCW5233682.1 aspartate aminotransferase family protein [Verminephrobacter eiseniae]MCW5294763.1 aspartate aminotransferase family protein [Verminephrobacter eiseniae]MCW8185411.1 aspartate aminotransferase family protein [Verminephrobacter eiseniae]MCW8222013.1 aspartate aminotransferase family protein [Verminephrobacter eiseniae]
MHTAVDTQLIQALDSAHFLHPFTDLKDLQARGARVITRAQDIYVWDSEDRRMLDAMSGLWCVNVGYGRKELADAASQQMMTLPYYNSFFQTTNVPAAKLAAKLAALAPDVGERSFKHVFYSSSGSESNDSNVRMVRRYWDLLGQPQRKTIISRMNAYHGSTMAGASLGGMRDMHAQGDLPIPGITHIGQPYFFENGAPGESAEDFGVRAAGWLETKILEVGAEKVAAFIAEPLQGAGGVIIPPASYWPEIQRIVDKYGILLISDEVICAFGRLGHWFGYEKFGYKPDLITFAKAITGGYIPLGGVMVGNRVAKVLIEQGGEFTHGYTYSGHPVACAVALANLDIMERENLPGRVRDDVGPYLARAFAQLETHPLVGVAETCGFVGGLVLVRNPQTREKFKADLNVGMVCRGHCFANGLIMRAVGDRMIIAPPLTMTHAQIDQMLALIVKCLDSTYADVRKNGWLA